ncbi:tripartite tricarboxylate transporter substrate-binding protein [Parapusillimonas sp. JC17]|uniref:tripartite tricarboxylate transporter substrate-binding protein n=1 Tax=Parapusillimonas sp. JC17 TaxID=3445768 RepID=UPI003F9F5C14
MQAATLGSGFIYILDIFATELIQQEKLVASSLVPDIPTLHEQGFKDFDVSTWYGLFTPAGVPDEIVNMLAEKTIAFLSTPKIREQFLQQGLETVANTPEQFDALLRSEVSKWSKVKLSK